MYLTGKQVVVTLFIPVIVGSIIIYTCIKMIAAADETKTKSVIPNNYGQYAVETYSKLPEWIAKNPEKKIELVTSNDGRICIVYRLEKK